MFGINFYEIFFNFVLDFVKTYKYLGIFVLSFFETLFAPIPSEIVLPFAGYLAYLDNNFSFLILSIIIGAFGNSIGSLPLYYIGYLGRSFVEKYGKYFFISKKRLKIIENWFTKNRFLTIFLSRCIPGFRSLVSIPAGIFKVNLKTYLLLTFFGFFIWNSFLVSLGFIFGEYWEKSLEYSRQIELISLIVILVFLTYLIIKYIF